MKRMWQLLAAFTLIYQVYGQPHGSRHQHRADRPSHEEATVIEVIVYVDEVGSTISVETKSYFPTSTWIEPAIATNVPLVQPVEDPIPNAPSLALPTNLTPPPPPPPPPSSIPYYSQNHQVESHRAIGISYSPYNDDGTCKTQDEVDQDLEKLAHYPVVRIYGIDCNQTSTVVTAAKQRNMKVFAGIFDLNGFPDSLKYITDAAEGDWSAFDTIAIGNELVNKGQNSPADVVGAVNSARDRLRAEGYQGPVVTVDTFSAILAHPELCEASDYCAANCHAFFDANEKPEQAGPYVKEQARKVSEAAGGKRTVITESGWPHAGEPNGGAIPSQENQNAAIASLKSSFPDGGLILFSAFDDKWKQDTSGTFSAEKFWGIA